MSNSNIDRILAALCVAALVGVYLFVSNEDAKDEQASLEHYCFMVKAYKNSKGAMGWPDHKGFYSEECK